MTKKYQIVITRFVFSSSKCTKIRFWPGLCPGPHWGSLRHSPDPLVGWGGGYPLPILLPARRSNSVSMAPRLSGPSAQNPGYASAESLLESVSSKKVTTTDFQKNHDCKQQPFAQQWQRLEPLAAAISRRRLHQP